MQFLSNLKIGVRLTGAFVVLMLLLVGIASVGLNGIGKTFELFFDGIRNLLV